MILRNLTTLRVGGPAERFVDATSTEEIRRALQTARLEHLPVTILGGGSNVLISDEGISGIVLKNSLPGISWNGRGGEVLVRAAGGVSWETLVVEAIERSLWGIENLSGIPGTVGAAPIQNIGAYGAEIGERIFEVEAIDIRSGASRRFNREECAFSYRNSFFKTSEGKNFLITAVTLALSKQPTPNLSYKEVAEYFKESSRAPTLVAIRDAILSIRARKFPDPAVLGTAGSFFKNPIVEIEEAHKLRTQFPEIPLFPVGVDRMKLSLAWILDHICNLRGYRKGEVGLFERQPLVIVNFGGASAQEIDLFANEIAEKVRGITGIEIEREVIAFGNFS